MGDATRFWSLRTISRNSRWGGMRRKHSSVCVSNDNQFIIHSADHQFVKVFHTKTGCLLKTLQHRANVTSCCISNDNQFIVSSLSDGTLKIWDVDLESLLDNRKCGINNACVCCVS